MDKPNALLVAAAIVFLIAAVALLFAPAELETWAGGVPTEGSTALLQVLGSALFGFGMLDWMSRYSRTEGIFGRPLLMANLAHTMTAAMLLGHSVMRGNRAPWAIAAMAVYALFAIAFGSRLFGRPRT